jgi:hypothetical protein
MVWLWLNPTLFAKPKNYDNWAAKAVLGERILMKRKQHPIPRSHAKAVIFLNTLQCLSGLVLIYGLWSLSLNFTLQGVVYIYLTKMWFLDRMVWLYESSSSAQ